MFKKICKLLFVCVVMIAFSRFTYASKKVEKIKLNTNNLTLTVGDRYTLAPSSVDDEESYEWYNTHPDVVEVKGGNLKAKKVGSALITVKTTSGDKEATCLVTVVNGNKKFTLDSCKDIKIKESYVIYASKEVKSWKISDLSVAKKKKSTKRKLKIVGKKKGKVTITAIGVDGKKASCKIKVKKRKKEPKKIWVEGEAQIYSSNIGYGHSYLIKSADGHLALYDIGRSKSGTEKAIPCSASVNATYNFAKEGHRLYKGKAVIDYLIISHYHGDHTSCLEYMLKSKKIILKRAIIKKLDFEDYRTEKIKGIIDKYSNSTKKIYSNNIKQETGIHLGKNAVIYLFNNNDVLKKCINSKDKYPTSFGEWTNIGKKDCLSINGKFPYITFNKKTNTFFFFFYSKNIYKKFKKIKKNKKKLMKYSYMCLKVSDAEGNACSQNSNSIAALVQFNVDNGFKYAYFTGDLQNDGYSFFGDPYSGASGAFVYGGGMETSKYDKPLSKRNTHSLKIPAEYNTAVNIRNFFGKRGGNVNNIVFYQASHHGLNDDPASLNVLGFTKRGKDLFVAKTSLWSDNGKRLRSYSYLKNASIYYMFNRNQCPVKETKDYCIGHGNFALGSNGKMHIVQ